MPTHLSLASESRGGIEILLAAGEIDLSTAPRLAEAIAPARDLGLPLIADLTGIQFLDSAGVRVLALAEHELAERGGRLLTVPSPEVRRVIELAHVESAFHSYATVDEALDAGRLFVAVRREQGD